MWLCVNDLTSSSKNIRSIDASSRPYRQAVLLFAPIKTFVLPGCKKKGINKGFSRILSDSIRRHFPLYRGNAQHGGDLVRWCANCPLILEGDDLPLLVLQAGQGSRRRSRRGPSAPWRGRSGDALQRQAVLAPAAEMPPPAEGCEYAPARCRTSGEVLGERTMAVKIFLDGVLGVLATAEHDHGGAVQCVPVSEQCREGIFVPRQAAAEICSAASGSIRPSSTNQSAGRPVCLREPGRKPRPQLGNLELGPSYM